MRHCIPSTNSRNWAFGRNVRAIISEPILANCSLDIHIISYIPQKIKYIFKICAFSIKNHKIQSIKTLYFVILPSIMKILNKQSNINAAEVNIFPRFFKNIDKIVLQISGITIIIEEDNFGGTI